MFLSSARFISIALVLCGVCGAGCGARTGIHLSDAGVDPPPVACATDLDCATGDLCAPAECREGVCASLPATVCNDQDECTTDGCDPNAPPVDNAKNCFDGCSANQENCGCTVGPDCGFID